MNRLSMVAAGSAIIPAASRRMARHKYGPIAVRRLWPVALGGSAAHDRRFPGYLRLALAGSANTVAILLLAGCTATVPERPPEVRTQTVEVKVPVPVPCFSEAERPVRAPPTPIDLNTATVDQLAAAIAADDLADDLYVRAVDALFLLCMRRIADGTATQPTGGKP